MLFCLGSWYGISNDYERLTSLSWRPLVDPFADSLNRALVVYLLINSIATVIIVAILGLGIQTWQFFTTFFALSSPMAAWRPCNWVSDQSAIIPFSVLPTPNSGWFFFTWLKILDGCSEGGINLCKISFTRNVCHHRTHSQNPSERGVKRIVTNVVVTQLSIFVHVLCNIHYIKRFMVWSRCM